MHGLCMVYISMENLQITVHLPRAVDLICEIRASIFNRTLCPDGERGPLLASEHLSTTSRPQRMEGARSLARAERIRFIGDGAVAGGGQMPLSLRMHTD